MNKRNELEAYTIEGSVDSDVVIHCFHAFCQTIEGPTVVVVDNASIHTSAAFQEAIPTWEKQGLAVFYLPAYSPELNLIEILWRFITCIPHIVIRVCVAMVVKAYHLATLPLIGGYLGQLWP